MQQIALVSELKSHCAWRRNHQSGTLQSLSIPSTDNRQLVPSPHAIMKMIKLGGAGYRFGDCMCVDYANMPCVSGCKHKIHQI